MEIIEKIRKEIERRMKIYKESNYGISLRYQELEELLSFLDTLSEEPDKSLEEAAEEYAKDYEVGPNRIAIKAFISGAEWQKRQMLKDAVEGRVFMSFAPGHNQMVMADVNLPTNTKVRIVVLKEEEG